MIECLTPVDLERYHAGEINEQDRVSIAHHLSSCQLCAERDRQLVEDESKLAPGVVELESLDAQRVAHAWATQAGIFARCSLAAVSASSRDIFCCPMKYPVTVPSNTAS